MIENREISLRNISMSWYKTIEMLIETVALGFFLCVFCRSLQINVLFSISNISLPNPLLRLLISIFLKRLILMSGPNIGYVKERRISVFWKSAVFDNLMCIVIYPLHDRQLSSAKFSSAVFCRLLIFFGLFINFLWYN